MAVRRACVLCLADVGERSCERGHDNEQGWYLLQEGRVIGLGHRDLPGYLCKEGGVDLRGYRLLGALRRPEVVVDLDGVTYVTQGVVKSHRLRDADGRRVMRVRCLRLSDSSMHLLSPSRVVRPLPNTDLSPKLLRAMWRAAQEEAGAA